jgi:hypothetical protein
MRKLCMRSWNKKHAAIESDDLLENSGKREYVRAGGMR